MSFWYSQRNYSCHVSCEQRNTECLLWENVWKCSWSAPEIMFCMMDIILWCYCIPRFEQHPKWNENSVIISTKTFFDSTTFRTNLIFIAPLMLYNAVGNEHCTVAPSQSKNIMSCPCSISHCCPQHPHLIFQSSFYPPSIIRYWIPSFLELAFSLSLLSKESPVRYKKVLSLLPGERKSVFFFLFVSV